MCAAQKDNVEAVKILLDKGAKIELQDDNGKTALMLAKTKTMAEAFELIIHNKVKNNILSLQLLRCFAIESNSEFNSYSLRYRVQSS